MVRQVRTYIRFGNAEIRPHSREVLVDGQPAVLGARAFDLLLALIDRSDRLVGKAELLELVWPGLVVEENNLQVQISALRKLLGPQVISTIPGRGYRFTAELDEQGPADPSVEPKAGRDSPAPANKLGVSEPEAQASVDLTASALVEARPDSVAYRAGNYALRHRTGIAMSVAATLAVVAAVLLGQSRAPAPAPTVGTTSASAAFSPPAHSIAVLPFVNMSGDPRQEYFSDGLSEELLDSLATIRDLQVAARTSSFTFKGKDADIADIAHRLNVGAVLEGSVRRDGSHVRITAQLINAVTGFHMWSRTYDRDLKDILKLQTEIATAVTKALQVTLLANADAAIEVGGTQNPQALDAYLRGARWRGNVHARKEDRDTAIADLSEAIRLDPGFAKAYSLKALFLDNLTSYVPESAVHGTYEQARASAERAVALAPALGEAHAILADVLEYGFLDFTGAATELDHALALSPGEGVVHSIAAPFLARIGRADEAVAHARRCVALDPLIGAAHTSAGAALSLAHRYREAIEEFDRAENLDPQYSRGKRKRGLQFLALGESERARESCSIPPINWENHKCLAIAYDKLHQLAEARAELDAIKGDRGDGAAYQYAEIYAQWGETSKGLDWIEKAYARRDDSLVDLEVDYLLDPLRKEPRFLAIERKLKFPN